MILHQTLEALRSDDAPQRRAQARMNEAVDAWRQGPSMARVEAEFARFAQGEALTRLPMLTRLFSPDDPAARQLVDGLFEPLTRLLIQLPLGLAPLRHVVDDQSATLVLCQADGAALVLQAIDGAMLARKLPPVAASFTTGESHERVLAGMADGELVTIIDERPNHAELRRDPAELSAGMVMHRNGARQCLIVRRAAGSLVSLKLQRRPQTGALTRQFALEDGAFHGQAAGSVRDSRLELAAALLGRMGRADAAPLLAAMAEEAGSQSLRWQSLRECLGLDTATGFQALCRIAMQSGDPLAEPAGALRAQLLEAFPQLEGIAQCPA